MKGNKVGSRHITGEERRLLHAWKQAGKSNTQIGALLGRHKSTIGRELRRNAGERGYHPRQAHGKAQARAGRPGTRRFTDAVRLDAEAKLRLGWTPEMISGRARLENRPWVCKETIYTHVRADAKAGGTLWQCLARAKRKRKRRCPRRDGRGRIPGQRMIDTRPPEVELRGAVGHWEGDLVNGAPGTGHLVTLVERKTRFALVARVLTKEAGEVCEVIRVLFTRHDARARLSVTFDNGKEFALHKLLSEQTGMGVYFAHPYHSWERGTNENRNGQIRRLHPKRSSFEGIGDRELARIESFLNDRPLKCLGWKTPREEMAAFLARVA